MSGQLADSPFIDQIMPKPKLPRKPLNPLVAALVYDGLCVFEFSCAAEVFGLPRPEFGADWYRFRNLRRRQAQGQEPIRPDHGKRWRGGQAGAGRHHHRSGLARR